MPTRRGVGKESDRGVIDRAQISGCDLPAATGPGLQPRESYAAEKRSLQLVETAVVADAVMAVLGGLPVVAKPSGLCVDARIIRKNRAPIAHGAEILGRIKARCGGLN